MALPSRSRGATALIAGRLVLSLAYTGKGGFFATDGLAALTKRRLDLLLIRCRSFEDCVAPMSSTGMLTPPLVRVLGFGFPALEAEAGAVAFFGTVRRRLFLLSLFILSARPCSAAPNDTKMV